MASTTQIFSESKEQRVDLRYANYNPHDIANMGARVLLSNGFYFESMPEDAGIRLANSSGLVVYEDTDSRWPLSELITYSSGVVCYRANSQYDDGDTVWKSCAIESNDSVEKDAVFKRIKNFFPLSEDRFLTVLDNDAFIGTEVELKLFDPKNISAPIAKSSHQERQLNFNDKNKILGAHLMRPNVLLVHFCHESRFLKINQHELEPIGTVYPYDGEYKHVNKATRSVESRLCEGVIYSIFNYDMLVPNAHMQNAYCFYENESGQFIGKQIDVEKTNKLFKQLLTQELNEINARKIPTVLGELIAQYASPQNIVLDSVLSPASPFLMWKTPRVSPPDGSDSKLSLNAGKKLLS